jgi:hypothetical protein
MFGELRWRTSGGCIRLVWQRPLYPVDNYPEWKRIKTFVGNTNLGLLILKELGLQVEEVARNRNPEFCVWGLVDVTWTTGLLWHMIAPSGPMGARQAASSL